MLFARLARARQEESVRKSSAQRANLKGRFSGRAGSVLHRAPAFNMNPLALIPRSLGGEPAGEPGRPGGGRAAGRRGGPPGR